MLKVAQSSATVECNYSIIGYNQILWYKNPIGDSTLKLIGYVYYTTVTLESEFRDLFNISGDGTKESELRVDKLQPEDSGVYYCAAGRHSDSVRVCLLQKPSVVIQLTSKRTLKRNIAAAESTEIQQQIKDGSKKKTKTNCANCQEVGPVDVIILFLFRS